MTGKNSHNVCGLACILGHASPSNQVSLTVTTKKRSLTLVCVLLCFIDRRVRNIRNEASSCLGIFSSTLRFYYMASFHGTPVTVSSKKQFERHQ